MKHPMQPIYLDEHGTPRFKENAIVRWLADTKRINLNEIAAYCQIKRASISQDDQEQFWQLLGYSVSGYGDLSFINRETFAKADEIAERILAVEEGER